MDGLLVRAAGRKAGAAFGRAINLSFILPQRSIFGIGAPMMQRNTPRYAVGLSENGCSWTVVDHHSRGFVRVRGGVLTLADEEQAGHWADLLNGVDPRQARRME